MTTHETASIDPVLGYAKPDCVCFHAEAAHNAGGCYACAKERPLQEYCPAYRAKEANDVERLARPAGHDSDVPSDSDGNGAGSTHPAGSAVGSADALMATLIADQRQEYAARMLGEAGGKLVVLANDMLDRIVEMQRLIAEYQAENARLRQRIAEMKL